MQKARESCKSIIRDCHAKVVMIRLVRFKRQKNQLNQLKTMMTSHLLNADFSASWRSSFGNGDGEDTILQTSLDSILVHASREVKRAMEFADRALANPVLELVVMLLGGGISQSSSGLEITSNVVDDHAQAVQAVTTPTCPHKAEEEHQKSNRG